MAYHASTVENVLKGLHEPYGIEIDGKSYDGRQTLILAGNGRFYGGGYNPVPEADPTDGLLEVLLIRAVDLITVMKVIGAYKQGLHRRLPQYITHLQAKSITIFHQEGKDMTVNLDGEIVKAPPGVSPGGRPQAAVRHPSERGSAAAQDRGINKKKTARMIMPFG